MFVGTKKQACDSVKEEAERVGAHYVNARWLGGMLTNFKTIKNRVKRLEQLHKMEEDGTFNYLPKKETIKLQLEISKLEKFIGGIKNMGKLPAAIFIVDPKKEKNAVLEAKKLGIPIVAIVDTNCDPDDVDYVIPGNDDAIRSVKLLVQAMGNAILEGRQGSDVAQLGFDNEAKKVDVENLANKEYQVKSDEHSVKNSEEQPKTRKRIIKNRTNENKSETKVENKAEETDKVEDQKSE